MASRAFRFNDTDFAYEAFDDEIVILNLASGTYYAVGGCAATFWGDLAQSRSVEAIAEAIANRSEDNADSLMAAFDGVVAQLAEERILIATEPSSEGALSAESAAEGCAPATFEKHSDMQDLLTLDPIHDVDPKKGWPHY